MKFNNENIEKYNVMKSDKTEKCVICNSETIYIDYCCNNAFCSVECQEKYYDWARANSKEA